MSETQTPSQDQPQGGEESSSPQASPPETPKAPAAEPWFMQRIGKLQAEKTARDAKIAELEAKLATPAPAAPSGARTYTPEEIDAVALQRATVLAAQTKFNEDCNKVYAQGLAAHSDFAQKLESYTKTFGGLTQPLIEALLEQEAPHEVLYGLTANLEEATKLVGLSPTRAAAALTKFALKQAEERRGAKGGQSRTPPPVGEDVSTRRGNGEWSLENPDTPMEEWVKLRARQIREARESRA